MAFFSRTKKTEETQSKEITTTTKSPKQTLAIGRDHTQVMSGPQITEKSVRQGEQNVYTFTVAKQATKFLVRDAVKAIYGVTPVKVNMVTKRPARRLKGSKNQLVKESGTKKAYVYLKTGDTINLV